jgi:hypothetical protein
MELPPGAIKDAECVGDACQVFVVSKCQNGSLEFGLADPETDEWKDQTAQRTLLNSGDFFYVPPGNIYRSPFLSSFLSFPLLLLLLHII